MIIPRRKPYFPPNLISKLFIGIKSKSLSFNNSEKLLEKTLGLPNPLLVSSGRIGLVLILQNLGIKKGSEIIMPGYTFGLLTQIIKNAGFVPKPVDIDYETYQMSPNQVDSAVTKNTKVILATHLFGEACDIKKIKKIAKKHNLFLIEDCAQSLGSKVDNKLLGTFGDAAFSSFNIAKPLHSIAGGVIFGKNRKLINKIRESIKSERSNIFRFYPEIKTGLFGYFVTQTFFWPIAMFLFGFRKTQKKFVEIYRHDQINKNPPIAFNPLLSEIVKENIYSFKRRVIKRRIIKDWYISLLKNHITFQKKKKNSSGTVYMIVGHLKGDIFGLRRYLAMHGIDIALANEIADDCLDKTNTTIKKALSDSIALPIYEDLKKSEVIYISNKIKSYIDK